MYAGVEWPSELQGKSATELFERIKCCGLNGRKWLASSLSRSCHRYQGKGYKRYQSCDETVVPKRVRLASDSLSLH